MDVKRFGSMFYSSFWLFSDQKSSSQVLSVQYPLNYPCDKPGYCNRVLDFFLHKQLIHWTH